MDQIYSTGEVSRLLGIQPYRIAYAIASGQLPEASFRFLGKRCFSGDDVRRIAKHFGVQLSDPMQRGDEGGVSAGF